jgi:ribosomal protein L37AE/L43A
VHELITTRAQSLCCPFCEVYDLERYGHSSLRCASRDNFLTGTLLETLRHIVDLRDAIGSHACECGHPEMKRVPDAGYWCHACSSEVLPAQERLETSRTGRPASRGSDESSFGNRTH